MSRKTTRKMIRKTLKIPHLLASAAAMSILATTTVLWAQSATPATPATAMNAASSASKTKPLSIEELVAAFTKAEPAKTPLI
ncbi:MAG: hypothetical protein Q7T07_17315 [Burkholderiaceae bacterium]|nr:hypothetical protein [Burkholderiaceae bacterium]